MITNICEKSYAVESRYSNFYTGGDVAWSADGTILYCLNGTTVNAVSVLNGQIIQTYGVNLPISKTATATDDRLVDDLEDDVVYSFALSANHEHLVTAHRSGLLRLWSRESGKIIKLWKGQHKGPIVKVAFSSCNRLVCSSGVDSTLRLWDFNQSRCHAVLKDFRGPALFINFHPHVEQTEIYAAGADHTIYCWNYESKVLLRELRGHISQVTGISFANAHADCDYLASVSRDKVLILWKLKDSKQYKVVPLYEDLEGVCFWNEFQENAPEFQVLVATTAGKLKLVNCTTAQIVPLEVNITQELKLLLHCAATQQLALVTAEHNILVYDVQNESDSSTSTLQVVKQLIGFNDEVLDMCLLGPQERYIAVATNSANIKLYDTAAEMNCKIFTGHKDSILTLSTYSATGDRHYLISAGKDHSLLLWQLQNESGDLLCILEHHNAHTATIGCVAFGHNAVNLLASVSQDGSMKVWELQGIENTASSKKAIAYNLKVKYAAVAHDKEINSVDFAPNNKILATASQDKTAKLWSSESQATLGTLRGHKRGVWCVRFSPVDQVVLTASADCTLRLWAVASLACLKTFEQDCTVLRAEFLDYGKYIISSASDGLLKLWNIKTNDCIQTLDAHEDRVWSLALPARSKLHFYSGGADSQLVKWRDTTDETRSAAIDKRQTEIEEEQLLANMLQQRHEWQKAFVLALRLNKPRTTYKIVSHYVRQRDEVGIASLVELLNGDQKVKLFQHIKTWNTNSRHAKVANVLLQKLLTDLISHPEEQRNYNTANLVEVMTPYVQRHFNRVSDLSKEIAFLEYLVSCI